MPEKKAKEPKNAKKEEAKVAEVAEGKKNKAVGRIVRVSILVAIVAAFVGILVMNASSGPSNEEQVWDMRTTVGNKDAKNYYVQYTDLACPYCDVFSRDIMDNEEEFMRDYIEGKDILYEVRVTDFLYEYGEHAPEMSRWSAEGTYCATQEDKFWDYYHQALKSLWKDYHSKGVGISKTSPEIKGMTKDYWVHVGEKVGMDKKKLAECIDSEETLAAVEENTEKASKKVQGGLPYFAFGKFKTGGFDPGWDFSYVKQYLDAGLKD